MTKDGRREFCRKVRFSVQFVGSVGFAWRNSAKSLEVWAQSLRSL
jgi:hypothetical protein